MSSNIIYFLSALDGSLIKNLDDSFDIYQKNHGSTITELLKILVVIVTTFLFIYANNSYLYLGGFITMTSYLFVPQAFNDPFWKFFSIYLLIYFFYNSIINLKNITLFDSFIFIILACVLNGYPFWIQEKNIIFQILNLNDFQINDAEFSYSKLIIRSFAILTCVIQLYYNKIILNYLNINNQKLLIAINCANIFLLFYYINSVIQQFYNLVILEKKITTINNKSKQNDFLKINITLNQIIKTKKWKLMFPYIFLFALFLIIIIIFVYTSVFLSINK